MGRISSGAPSDVAETTSPVAVRTPSRPLASSLFAVRRGRQPLDLEEAGSAAAYVTASNDFLTASVNVLGNATRHRQDGERGNMLVLTIDRPPLHLSDQFLIDGDTSDTRIPFKRPSVIFPSVENKPTIVNSSFTYDAGKNLNGVTVDIPKREKKRVIWRTSAICFGNGATKQVFENDHCSVTSPT